MRRKTATQIIQETHIRRHPLARDVHATWINQVVRDGRQLDQYRVTTATYTYLYYFDAEMYTVVDKVPFKRALVAV